jgi:hypothetical protein
MWLNILPAFLAIWLNFYLALVAQIFSGEWLTFFLTFAANHTPRFWNIVQAQSPSMEKAKAWLKENGQLLEQSI